ncbi:MAG: translation initiation factor [Bacteroidetes bacterium]|nr:translation initiation factor [Bacteroidota bacterium]MBI3481707.1 translation initiation factor [Bacteroidota bacterium]
MAKKNEWKNRDGVVYSTNQNFQYEYSGNNEADTLPAQQQNLKVLLDKSGRAGKQVTLVTGFLGKPGDLESLTKLLKTKCGVGGSSKNGEIILQGDLRDKVVQALIKEGYKAKRIG